MTNYEKIKFLLEMGVYKGVEVHIIEDRFQAYVILVKEDRGMFYDRYGIEFMDEKINKYNVTSITPIPNPPKLLPVGTKVRVFEEYDYTRWEKEYEIDSINIGEYILKCRGSIFRCPFRAVYPVLD